MEMELEEIQCPLCKEQFNEKVRTPMLLPDCGHSYCVQCIEEHSTETGFNLRRRTTFTPNDDDDETLVGGNQVNGKEENKEEDDRGDCFDMDENEVLTKGVSADPLDSAGK